MAQEIQSVPIWALTVLAIGATVLIAAGMVLGQFIANRARDKQFVLDRERSDEEWREEWRTERIGREQQAEADTLDSFTRLHSELVLNLSALELWTSKCASSGSLPVRGPVLQHTHFAEARVNVYKANSDLRASILFTYAQTTQFERMLRDEEIVATQGDFVYYIATELCEAYEKAIDKLTPIIISAEERLTQPIP